MYMAENRITRKTQEFKLYQREILRAIQYVTKRFTIQNLKISRKMIKKILHWGSHLEYLIFSDCFIDTENMSLSPTRIFKIKHLRIFYFKTPKHSLLSFKDFIERMMNAIKNCSLKDSLEDFNVDIKTDRSNHGKTKLSFRYTKGRPFSWPI